MLFNKKFDEEPIAAFPPKPRKPEGATPTRSVIDPWLRITGNLEGEGELQIDGHIVGDIRCAQLVVGKAATVEGNITAEEVIVRGKVTGVIRSNRVILQDGALVESEIFHRRLTIEEGALFEGTIRMRENPMDELLAVAAEMRAARLAKGKPVMSRPESANAQPAAAASSEQQPEPANSKSDVDLPADHSAANGSDAGRGRAQPRERRAY